MVTQGKWYTSEHDDNNDVVIRTDTDQRIVANCEVDFVRAIGDAGQQVYEILANAYLIAASA